MELQLEPNLFQTSYRVDKELGIIYDVVAMQEGEARGHQLWADNITLRMMAQLGNLSSRPIRGRFGHPGMSENATGKQVSTNRNFQVIGNKLVHEFHAYEEARLSPSFTKDPIEFIFQVAENSPTELGESVVIDTETVWVLESGEEFRTENFRPDRDDEGNPLGVTTPYPVMRPEKFYYVDIVSEGALTPDGMFTMFSGIDNFNSYAEQAFRFLDAYKSKYNLTDEQLDQKLKALLRKYKNYRGLSAMPRKRKKFEDEETQDVNVTVDVEISDPVEEEYEGENEGEAVVEEPEPEEEEESVDDMSEAMQALEESKQLHDASTSENKSGELAQMRKELKGAQNSIRRLQTIVTQSATHILSMQRQITQLQGDEQVNFKLPDLNNGNFEQMQFAAKPKHVPQAPSKTPENRVMETQMNRFKNSKRVGGR